MVLSSFGGMNSSAKFSYTPSWPIPQGTELVYNITSLAYNGTDFIPVQQCCDEYNNSYDIGVLRQNNLFFIGINEYPSFDDQIRLYARGTEMQESFEIAYDYNHDASWNTDDGPFMFEPIHAIPDTASEWTNEQSAWSSLGGISATYTAGDSFSLSGSNATANVTSFGLTWDVTTGIMTHYAITFIDGDGITTTLGMEYMYSRNYDDWGMHWGVDVGATIMFSWDTILLNNSEGEVEINNGINVSSGDLMALNIWELSDLSSMDRAPNFNGSLQTIDNESEFNYEFLPIGASNDGPTLFYLILPMGNDYFIGNTTDEFRGLPNSEVSITGDMLSVSYTNNYNGITETGQWDLTTGILKMLHVEFTDDEGTFYNVTMSFRYYLNSGEPTFSFDQGIGQRYIIDQAVNGTQHMLDFGTASGPEWEGVPDEQRPHFIIFEGELMEIQSQITTMENDMALRSYLKTSHGSVTDIDLPMNLPGFKIDGPPMFMPVIPTSSTNYPNSADWWNLLDDVYSSLDGYTVTNTADEFAVAFNNEFDGNAKWFKDTGIMSYYYVSGFDENNNSIVWEMHAGITVPTHIDWQWGLTVGSSADYEVTKINMNGVHSMPYGPNNETTVIEGSVIAITFNAFGNIADLTAENSGPWTRVTEKFNGVSQTYEIGIEEPGFELAPHEDKGIPFLAWAIPIGPANYWQLLADLYSEAGYTVTNNATTFEVYAPLLGSSFVDVAWQKSDGLMIFYNIKMIDSEQNIMELTIVLHSSATSTTNSTSSTTGTDTPVNPLPVSFVPLVLVFATYSIWRRKKKF